jgi:hypothetical protein
VISDVPETAVQIQWGSADGQAAVSYASQPISHLQQSWYRKEVRKNNPLEDHIVRKVNLLNQARIDQVPTLPFSNWMDIPNIVMCLPNGSKVDRLHFCYKMPGSIVPDSICICNLRRKDKS